MKEFTAQEARALMPDRFEEMVEEIHERIRAAAEKGLIECEVFFDGTSYSDKIPFKVVRFLKEEGFNVIFTNGAEGLRYKVDWRES